MLKDRLFTDEQADEIIRLRAQGETLHALAKRFGVHHSTIHRMCSGEHYKEIFAKYSDKFPRHKKRLGASQHKCSKLSTKMLNKIYYQLSIGHHYSDVAKMFDVCKFTVFKLMTGKYNKDLRYVKLYKKWEPLIFPYLKKRAKLTEEEKAYVIKLREQGLTFELISERTGIPLYTAYRVARKYYTGTDRKAPTIDPYLRK